MNGGCRGCEEEHSTGDCFTHDCVKEKTLDFCGQCKCFPCDTLMTKPRSTVFDRDCLALGRTIVTDITGLQSTRASELIKLLVDNEVIMPVIGHGKGKYRFQEIGNFLV